MTRRKDKKLKKEAAEHWKSRVDKLIAIGWISHETEIPHNAIPVDPDLINLPHGTYMRPTYYRAVEFTCSDCGKHQRWEPEDQRWYYEATGAPFYSTAKRCRRCRTLEQNRICLARIAAGHEKQSV